jgi:hypothetical protein
MLVSLFWLQPSFRTPRDIFPDSSTMGPKSSNEIPKGQDNPSSSGTKSSPHVSKALSSQNASPRTMIPGLCAMENLQNSKLAETPMTIGPNNPFDGPSKPSSLSSIEAWHKPSASFVGLEEKLGTDPRISQSACCGLCREPFFSGAVVFIQIHRWLMKGCHALPHEIRIVWDHTRTEHGICLACWFAFFHAGCISIGVAVTLGYE